MNGHALADRAGGCARSGRAHHVRPDGIHRTSRMEPAVADRMEPAAAGRRDPRRPAERTPQPAWPDGTVRAWPDGTVRAWPGACRSRPDETRRERTDSACRRAGRNP
ncbi:hypothetical protein TPA0909_50090 [Streptomyces albus]|nr:hypothetical protein TPA0909_50090 [Streptomyces albus]